MKKSHQLKKLSHIIWLFFFSYEENKLATAIKMRRDEGSNIYPALSFKRCRDNMTESHVQSTEQIFEHLLCTCLAPGTKNAMINKAVVFIYEVCSLDEDLMNQRTITMEKFWEPSRAVPYNLSSLEKTFSKAFFSTTHLGLNSRNDISARYLLALAKYTEQSGYYSKACLPIYQILYLLWTLRTDKTEQGNSSLFTYLVDKLKILLRNSNVLL